MKKIIRSVGRPRKTRPVGRPKNPKSAGRPKMKKRPKTDKPDVIKKLKVKPITVKSVIEKRKRGRPSKIKPEVNSIVKARKRGRPRLNRGVGQVARNHGHHRGTSVGGGRGGRQGDRPAVSQAAARVSCLREPRDVRPGRVLRARPGVPARCARGRCSPR